MSRLVPLIFVNLLATSAAASPTIDPQFGGHAVIQRDRSIDAGSANGAEKMAEFVLNDDITIQINGKKNTNARTSSARLTSNLGSRRVIVMTPAPG